MSSSALHDHALGIGVHGVHLRPNTTLGREMEELGLADRALHGLARRAAELVLPWELVRQSLGTCGRRERKHRF